MRSSRSGSSELCRAAMGIGVFYIASKTGIRTGGRAAGRPREKQKSQMVSHRAQPMIVFIGQR